MSNPTEMYVKTRRVCLSVVLILFPVLAPWLVAEFRQTEGTQPVASAKQHGGAA